jgi:hypothetical protein
MLTFAFLLNQASPALEFHVNWSDYTGTALNSTVNNWGHLEIRIDNSSHTVPKPTLMKALVRIEENPSFPFPPGWIDCHAKYLTNTTLWLFSVSPKRPLSRTGSMNSTIPQRI